MRRHKRTFAAFTLVFGALFLIAVVICLASYSSPIFLYGDPQIRGLVVEPVTSSNHFHNGLITGSSADLNIELTLTRDYPEEPIPSAPRTGLYTFVAATKGRLMFGTADVTRLVTPTGWHHTQRTSAETFNLNTITALAGIAIGVCAVLWRLARRRYPDGHCEHCGYNLHGLIDPRCPECGRVYAVPELPSSETPLQEPSNV